MRPTPSAHGVRPARTAISVTDNHRDLRYCRTLDLEAAGPQFGAGTETETRPRTPPAGRQSREVGLSKGLYANCRPPTAVCSDATVERVIGFSRLRDQTRLCGCCLRPGGVSGRGGPGKVVFAARMSPRCWWKRPQRIPRASVAGEAQSPTCRKHPSPGGRAPAVPRTRHAPLSRLHRHQHPRDPADGGIGRRDVHRPTAAGEQPAAPLGWRAHLRPGQVSPELWRIYTLTGVLQCCR